MKISEDGILLLMAIGLVVGVIGTLILLTYTYGGWAGFALLCFLIWAWTFGES